MNRYYENNWVEQADLAHVTMADASVIHAAGHTGLRNVKLAVPYGVTARPVEGDEVVLLPLNNGEYVILGTVCRRSDVQSGEILLQAKSGAYIKLKANGEIELNGMVIRADGTMG